MRDGIFIVVPAYNEARAIGTVVTNLMSAGWRNVLVIDDGSSDETRAAARAAGALVLTHVINRGQGAALQTGISYALQRGAEVIVTFDSDGQHRVEDLEGLIAPILDQTADVALGSRFLGSTEKIPRSRKLLLRAAVWFTRFTSGLRVTDAHNGLRAFSRNAAARIHIDLDRMAHASELIDQVARGRMRFVEVPVHIRYSDYSRRKGQSSLGAFRVLFDYIWSRWTR
jgi:glycosyltransferase involved in cell wall biosynthesis